jgi:RNA polymerase sigma-70 factor (ECF subfamily)
VLFAAFGAGTNRCGGFDHGRQPVRGVRVPTAFERFRAGERTAFDEVMREYAGSAYAVAVKVLGDPGLAEEAVQEAFVRIWERAGAFDGTRGNERTWILSIVRNQAIDMLRKRQRQRERSIDDEPAVYGMRAPDDVWASVATTLTSEAVMEALARLPSEQRETVMLAYYGGLRPVEIARRTGTPEGTVRSRLRLGLLRLRGILGGQPEVVEA